MTVSSNRPELLDTIIIGSVAGIIYWLSVFFDQNSDMERFLIRKHKVKYYALYFAKTVLYTIMMYRANYVIKLIDWKRIAKQLKTAK